MQGLLINSAINSMASIHSYILFHMYSNFKNASLEGRMGEEKWRAN
jgi:hypothetical protein